MADASSNLRRILSQPLLLFFKADFVISSKWKVSTKLLLFCLCEKPAYKVFDEMPDPIKLGLACIYTKTERGVSCGYLFGMRTNVTVGIIDMECELIDPDNLSN
ncbi:unnamed protein product [Lactuca virosa]|uniref:Uncharacterized protein n=1 Tax=Lactuca virosa TaxID=75947 RepID=A0AAU9LCV8_9ASTR|nr:unnamed protein product [Lactuca virosa]